MNWRSPLWLCAFGALLAALVLVLGVRRHSFDLELVDEYTGGEDGVEEPTGEPLE